MKTMQELKKEQAIKALQTLDIYKPYIRGFEKKGQVCFFENYGGFWVEQEPEIYAKMQEIEKKYNCTVYAITHEFTEFGECYDFLIITDYEEEWEDLVIKNDRDYIAFAYVWNKTDEDCSEFGSIGVRSFGGGIKRIA